MEEAKEDEGGLKGVSHAPLMQEYVGEYMYFNVSYIHNTSAVVSCVYRACIVRVLAGFGGS